MEDSSFCYSEKSKEQEILEAVKEEHARQDEIILNQRRLIQQQEELIRLSRGY